MRARLLILCVGLFGSFAAGLLMQNYLFERIREDEAAAEAQYQRFELILNVEQALNVYRHRGSQVIYAAATKNPEKGRQAKADQDAASVLLDQYLTTLHGFDPDTATLIQQNLAEAPAIVARYVRAFVAGDTDVATSTMTAAQHRFDAMEDRLEHVRARELKLLGSIQKQSSERAQNLKEARALITIVIIISGALLMVTIQRSILNPLRSTTEAIRQVNSGELTIDLPPQRGDEFGEMAQAIRHFRDRSEKLQRMAYHDPLTGLGNRAKLEEAATLALATASEDGGAVALLYLDLDNFRSVNQRLGHSLGDRYLVEAVNRIHRFVPAEAAVFRYSGDKFVVLLRLPADRSNAESELKSVAGFVLRGVAEPYPIPNDVLNMSTSIGMAISPEDGSTAEQLISSAEAAVFAAKKSGRNIARFAGGKLSGQLRAQKALANEIRRGIEENQFDVYYQPIVDAGGRRVTGAEALLRWHHPRRGLLTAGHFISVAEEEGLISQLSLRCLETVHRQVSIWRQAGHDWRVAVNLSANQMQEGRILDVLSAMRPSSDADQNPVDLELTETALFDTSDDSRRLLNSIRQLGYRIGMDDFGTGYSSFNYLQWLPIDKLKIDRQFVSTMEVSRQAKGIISATIALAHNLDLDVVAEGVETASQASALLKLGCHLHQGFHYSPALPADDFVGWSRDFVHAIA